MSCYTNSQAVTYSSNLLSLGAHLYVEGCVMMSGIKRNREEVVTKFKKKRKKKKRNGGMRGKKKSKKKIKKKTMVSGLGFTMVISLYNTWCINFIF